VFAGQERLDAFERVLAERAMPVPARIATLGAVLDQKDAGRRVSGLVTELAGELGGDASVDLVCGVLDGFAYLLRRSQADDVGALLEVWPILVRRADVGHWLRVDGVAAVRREGPEWAKAAAERALTELREIAKADTSVAESLKRAGVE
jgi:hypothetical protein